jgi:hypothetical protein
MFSRPFLHTANVLVKGVFSTLPTPPEARLGRGRPGHIGYLRPPTAKGCHGASLLLADAFRRWAASSKPW